MSTDFGFTCPAGGKWYACAAGTSRFVGCCTSDPCTNGCVQGNIKPAAYNATMHGKFPDASCGSASNFYTCGFGQTFWGCCKTNACKADPGPACKDNDLVPSFMERPEQFSAYAPTPTPKASDGSGKGAVIGGVVGGVVVFAIVLGILAFLFCRKRKRAQQQAHTETGASAATPMMEERVEDRFSTQYGQSPPPTYSSPNPNVYQSMPPIKDQPYYQQYHHYGHSSVEPQELPAEISSPAEQRYSELPAGASASNAQRTSALPPGASRVAAELESPHVSPRPLQAEFSTDLAKQAIRTSGAAPEQKPVEKN